ncbi:hypothetical protein CCR75_001452 [Bremia lactucae]|uniref:Uncharacterized protein n=1 Tax=Bremia lactucae TaxID=4779 RepID=A0A976ILY8_BRELC|nr:hypothetical protein CCR75_001452 [Bremia lactucae]
MDANTYFGDDFGQKIDLTVRIREILRNYPEGTSIFKEMVQNADDAGATEVSLCIDYRQHAATGLAYEKLASFQGPSLLIYNNATFSDADFLSIQRIGDSLKKDNSNGWKTGRFGVGFNSVYHMTDLPAFVSGSQLVFFDPQACHLPNVNPSNPGKMVDFIAHPNLVSNYSNQMAPFRCFGCNFSGPFMGTIFRLALRTADQAQQSRLSNRIQTPAKVAEMLQEFAETLQTVLLFLRNVCKITIWEWKADDDAPTVQHEAWINNLTPETAAKRSLRHASLGSSTPFATPQFPIDGIVCDYPLVLHTRCCVTQFIKVYEFMVMNQLGGGECTKIACEPANANQRLVPWGGVAVPTNGDFANATKSGLAFCFLPLPTHTYLPVHVNGYFELSSNRRDIWFGEGLSGEGLLRAQWNISILCDVIAPCYARAIIHLAGGHVLRPDQHIQLLPQAIPPAPWDSLTFSFFSQIRDKLCLYSEVEGGRWVSPAESMVICSTTSNREELEQLLIEDGFPVVRILSEDLERVLVKTETMSSYVGPQTLRDLYKSKLSSHAGNMKATVCLLDFMLSDLDPSRLDLLVDVNFLPIADGSLQTFKKPVTFDSGDLEYLCSMGFVRQHAAHALVIAGPDGVEIALNWLLQNTDASIALKEGGNSRFFIPSHEESILLAKARSHLVNIEAISITGLNLLTSNKAQTHLNVQKLDFQDFVDLLAVVLPAAWFGKPTVPWSGRHDSDEPSEEWFRELWKYIGPSKQLLLLKDKWPIVPTASNSLAQLSLSAGVVSAELIPDGCIQCLKKLQVRLLLPKLFASFQPNSEVWQFIHQPTPVGVLSCIGVALGTRGMTMSTEVRLLFKDADRHDREQLLSFLMSGDIKEIGAAEKRICHKLPIFSGFCAIEQTKQDCDINWMAYEADSEYSPVFLSLEELMERHLEPLMCMGIASTFLDSNFIYVKEGDEAHADFLSYLGVRQISKVDFFSKYLVPRFDQIKPKARVKFVYQLLVELHVLLAQDDADMLLSILETAAIFPTMSGDLKSIGDLYDPEINEFIDIMDETFFPALELQDPMPLSALRSLGLQRTLSRRSILSLAVSLERDQMRITNGSAEPNSLDEISMKLRCRSLKFFQYVDSRMDQLVTPIPIDRLAHTLVKKSKKREGIRFLRSFLSEDRLRNDDAIRNNVVPTTEELEKQAFEKAEIADFKAKLAIIEWIPVSEEQPHFAAPWYKQGERVIVASPQQSRPAKQLWLCSSQFHVIKCTVQSKVLRNILGWDKSPTATTIAIQLKKISELYDAHQVQDGNDSNAINDRDIHVIWPAVYNIYQMLSVFFETELGERRSQVSSILSDNGKYVWVGDRFVSATHVASIAVVNAEPLLYTIPNELLHFRPFLRAIGVRERFALADYVYVLGAMYKDCRGSSTLKKEEQSNFSPLSSDRLTTIIGLIQLISDTLQHHSDYELFAPDRNGVLDFAASLTYDDAPWLDKRDYETSSGTIRFIHPKISNDVAAKIGSRSLRHQLLSENGHNELAFGGVEAFGQTEAITKRIAHILEQYPDGPNIINELIQNADDAGATRVSILYNSCMYGTSSLLSPAMAKWQGPALYCYNDAEFSDGDFISLASIGQASKLQRAATTGRFGLGFNSVYHFTDLPSIVSAKSIIMFDPHATHLPGISAANPGIKIRFVDASIVHQFPDQFAPFKDVFGCDLTSHYRGTLFRFPLRNSSLAESSQIKRRGYSHRAIVRLFKGFQESIIETMLFLRNVRKVDVYLQPEIDSPPIYLYGAEVPEEDRGETWRTIDRFMCNDESPRNSSMTHLSSKREFYARLRSTPTESLPSVTQVLNIRCRQQKNLQELFLRFGKVASQEGTEANMIETKAATEDHLEETIEKYLVCNQIGGGKARDMACAAENESLKLIPWVGIASRIDGGLTEGRAFCFLPLPVRVGLPVHVNGYFELSSNRRDIWIGDDMSGDGKLRSEWNANLLVDAVAPAYLNFLLKLKAMNQIKTAQYLSYFPVNLPSSPWNSIVLELFRIMKSQPMFLASASQHMKNEILEGLIKFVKPSSCVLIDDDLSDWKILEDALGTVSLTTVHVPVALRKMLLQLDGVYGAMTPAFFRQLTRQGDFLPVLERGCLKRVIRFCLSDCQGSSSLFVSQALDNLPILPLKSGIFEKLSIHDKSVQSNESSLYAKQESTYYFGNAIEEQLLGDFHHRVLFGEFKELFDVIPAVYDCSNLSVLNLDTILKNFLPHMLGRCWSKIKTNIYALASPSEMEGDKREWVRLLWTYVDSQIHTIDQALEAFVKWPLVPILCGDGNRWVCLSANVSLVIPQKDKSPDQFCDLRSVLGKLGVYVVNTSYISGDKCLQWLLARKYAHMLTSNGILEALNRYQYPLDGKTIDVIFAKTTENERQILCNFFAQNAFDSLSNDLVPILFELPIFAVYTKHTSGHSDDKFEFSNLRRGGYLPDPHFDTRLLDNSFFRAETEGIRRFLRDCGVDEWSSTTILLDHVFPQLQLFENIKEDLVDSVIVSALETLAYHQRNDSRFYDVVTTQAIVPSRQRIFRKVHQLHDPSVSELSDLVGDNSLPALAFSTPSVIQILRSLGLRSSLSCHAVLDSARSIEAMYGEGGGEVADQAYAKARSLLTIVNNHFDKMMAELNANDAVAGQESHDTDRIHDIVADLGKIKWLPIHEKTLDPAMPWKWPSESGDHHHRLSNAVNVRSQKNAWLCSSSMDILNGELTSEVLIYAFGWNNQIESFVIAKQLEAFGLRWEKYETDRLLPSFSLPCWRFPLSEVQLMYEILEKCRQLDEESWKASFAYRRLANARWIWTGKQFVHSYQIAVEANASLEPLVYCCPSEHIIPRSLLASFDLKLTFLTVDYLEAILRLPRNVILSEKQVAACLKIYQIFADDISSLESALESFATQELVLLDQFNHLVPSVQLTFDDMEWNESREARQGATFVCNKVPKTVAGLLGAASLHSKLAQTSMTSERVVCPSIRALQTILPPHSEWFHVLLQETIFAAEHFGGTQVDFFLDYRHHPSQRVIQPSLQPLQYEALCIHIHDVVLSANDVNKLYQDESSRTGLLCGFVVSDCMQILSGEGFYVLDPTGAYLSSSTGTTAANTSALTSFGLRYNVHSHNFARYPDQLLPFTTLPSCPSNVPSGLQSTLIRFPWRKSGSALSSYVLNTTKADKFIAIVKSQLYQTLIFTETVHRISLWGVGKESEFALHCHGEASLDAPDQTLCKRRMTRQNQEWKKRFSLHSFFKSPVIPENQMEFVINLELENKQYRDVWLFADNIGLGRSRELACSPVHEMLRSTPYVSVACHIWRNDSPAPRLRGHVYNVVCTQQFVGLPVHINGCFKTTTNDKQLVLIASLNESGQDNNNAMTNGNEIQIAAGWNRILLEDSVSDAYAKLLMVAKRCYKGLYPKALYNIWPTLQKRKTDLGAIVQAFVYHSVAKRDLFLCTDGIFRPLSNSYQLDFSCINIQVSSFAQLHFPALDIPAIILQDCARFLPSHLNAVTPKLMRHFLRSFGRSDILLSVCLPLLEYCLSDLPFPLPSETDLIWAEFHGLPLLPLEDGSIGVLQANQRRMSYIIGSYDQIELLEPVKNLFVSLLTLRRLHKYFSETRFISIFGLTSFSIKILADNIERVLPSSWKYQETVEWDPNSPVGIDQLWLYRFWQVVHYERRSLDYFSSWPLIPLKGSRLLSCSKMGMAVCVWDDSADSEITSLVAQAFQASATEQESKMAGMEDECKRWTELSAKVIENEEIADESYLDEEEFGEIEVDEETDCNEEALNEAKVNRSASMINPSGGATSIQMDDTASLPAQVRDEAEERAVDANDAFPISISFSSLTSESFINFEDSQSLAQESNTNSEEVDDNPERGSSSEDSTVSTRHLDIDAHEFCSRDMLHSVLFELNVTMLELAYFKGQEQAIVPHSPDVALIVLEGIFAVSLEETCWADLSETRADFIAEFFAHHGETHGGFTRVQLEKLKVLPIYVNIRNVPCAIEGSENFFLIPPNFNVTDIPLPLDAQHCFLKSNPRLDTFYKELGVEEMSDSKLLIYILPMFCNLQEEQRNQVLDILLLKWQSLRDSAELKAVLKETALFRNDDSNDSRYRIASSYHDPQNNVLATIFAGIRGKFPAQRYQTPEWLNLMSEIGLQTEVTVDIYVECAQRIDGQCSGKQALSIDDEHLLTTLHQFFVQNVDKFDRSRSFFERIISLSFVPAVVYDKVSNSSLDDVVDVSLDQSYFTSRLVVRRYLDCAIPDDEALVFSTTPIMSTVALPPRVLFSRLGIKSPPPKDQVVNHLFTITRGDRAMSFHAITWQFFLPMDKVFQAIFKFLQENWEEFGTDIQQRLANAAIIPVGSTLVKGSRLFFHLREHLAPLLFEVPRVYGAYDSLFRHLGSKDAPQVSDYIRLLRDLKAECCSHPLNLNELIATVRAIDLLVAAMAESNYRLSLEEKSSIFLPSNSAVMQSMLMMVYNDSASLCTSISLTELHVVHPRITTKCCKILEVPGITQIVTEELNGDLPLEVVVSDEIAHYNSVLTSQQFADGMRKIITAQQQKTSSYDAMRFTIDYEDLNERIVNLVNYEIKCVVELNTRFIAKLKYLDRIVDVSKPTHQDSLSFLDQANRRIYITLRTVKGRMRSSYLVAQCINQLLGRILQDCSVLECILTCDEVEIPEILNLLGIYEDPLLITDKLRGVLGQPLCRVDGANVELAPLRSCQPGELVAVEDENGNLCYAKILKKAPEDAVGIYRYEVTVNSSSTRWMSATQLYFFRSSRMRSSASELSGRRVMDHASNFTDDNVALPSSVVPISPVDQGSELVSEMSVPKASGPTIPPANILSAVNDLLSRLNVTLDSSVEDLMAENIQLQHRLKLAEASRRAAATQIEKVLRDKKEIQDSLVCAVCLENQVNRVLIPCGHIYCASCVQQLPRPSCPICRQNIVSSSTFHVPS